MKITSTNTEQWIFFHTCLCSVCYMGGNSLSQILNNKYNCIFNFTVSWNIKISMYAHLCIVCYLGVNYSYKLNNVNTLQLLLHKDEYLQKNTVKWEIFMPFFHCLEIQSTFTQFWILDHSSNQIKMIYKENICDCSIFLLQGLPQK